MIRLLLLAFFAMTNLSSAQIVKKQATNRQNRQKDNYDSAIAKAALAIDSGQFVKAKSFYQRALALRPDDPFAFQMIKRMDNNLKVLAASEERDIVLRKKAEINTFLEEADNALTQKKLDSAVALYIHILSLNLAKSQEEFVVRRLEALGQSLGSPAKNQMIENAIKGTNSNARPTALAEQTPATVGKKAYRDFSPDVFKKNVNKTTTKKITSNTKPSVVTNSPKSLTPTRSEPTLEKSKVVSISKAPAEVRTVTAQRTPPTSPVSDKAVVNARSNLKSPNPSKEEKAYTLLMYQALKAINSKNYKEARMLYQKMIDTNTPNIDKASIQVVIKSIDDVIAKNQKKGLK